MSEFGFGGTEPGNAARLLLGIPSKSSDGTLIVADAPSIRCLRADAQRRPDVHERRTVMTSRDRLSPFELLVMVVIITLLVSYVGPA